ncbi:excinuclease ABC subunit UvrA, partial [bacterium]|nr:excinuclease ABC subunit UvrA [bacterium]
MSEKIIIKGAREHNLKNIDLEIPRDQLVVITGISGSGKSSLAFDTIYAEGQRRYVESLSAYARQFLGLMEKPDVDYIEGLSPAISIEQRKASQNPRSTVATVTEIYDYLRLLFARIGTPYCYNCGKPIQRQTVQQIVDNVLSLAQGTKIQVLAPIIRGRKGEYREVFEEARRDGFVRVRVDGAVHDLSSEIKLEKNKKHDIEIIVDRLVVDPKINKRLADSVQTALGIASGLVLVDVLNGFPDSQHQELFFSENFACVDCSISYDELAPRMFSFNSPYGACPACNGLGTKMEVDPELVVREPTLSLRQGAIAPWGESRNGWYFRQLEGVAEHYDFDLETPWQELSPDHQNVILFGSDGDEIRFVYTRESKKVQAEWTSKYEGVVNNLDRRYKETESQHVRSWIEEFMQVRACPQCHGARLRKEALAVRVANKNIHELTGMSIKQASRFFSKLTLTEREQTIARQILKEICDRLGFLVNVGLDYLTLDRSAGTLSGGEAQRI